MRKRRMLVAITVVLTALCLMPGCGRHAADENVDEIKEPLIFHRFADDSKDKISSPQESIDDIEESVIEGVDIPEQAEHEEYTLTITATGDCTLGNTQDQSYDGSFNAFYDSYGADYFFENVRGVFESDDFTVVNLECVLSTSNDRVEKQFNLKGKPEYVSILTGSSVEACSLGNNHTYDYGESGFQETKSVLDEAGIIYAYTEQEGVYTTDDGVKVGIVSSSLLSNAAERGGKLKEEMKRLREEGAEVIIACCHWGIEKEHYPTDEQQSLAHEMIDAGADLVIGNHPHVLQGVEIYNERVILYSLGNFCFGGNKNPSDKNTMIYQQTFTIRDGEVLTDDIDARILPCRLSSADGYNDYQPYICSDERKQTIIQLVNEYSEPYGGTTFDEEGLLITE